jgi:hypothetical protein
MTATITTTEKVTGWTVGTVPADPFANIPDDDALAEQFAAIITAPAAEAPAATCKGCGRILRAAKSRALGRGPVCQRRYKAAITTESADYTQAQLVKALDALDDDAVMRVGHLFLVVSSDGSTRYETAPTGECSCTAARYGRRCWHTLAVRIAATAGLPATDPDSVGFPPQEDDTDGDSYSADPLNY